MCLNCNQNNSLKKDDLASCFQISQKVLFIQSLNMKAKYLLILDIGKKAGDDADKKPCLCGVYILL